MKYEPVIGIETHVQLKTKSKLFCGCDNDAREAEPNTQTCPVCMGFPGTLPVLNAEAVRLALRLGQSLNGDIPRHTKFDRKNYFYPDLPKGYQISQFDKPIVGRGRVDLPDGSSVRITRAHMEEDAGKLVHPAGVDYSLVDLNRAGTPLIEIVSEPDIRSSAQAKLYAQELYNLVRYAGVSDANLYYGNMRFDVNISLRPAGAEEFGTRAEIKNLNSFRAVERACNYEIERQAEMLDGGHRVVQETRGWDDAGGKTFSQRSKEEAHDYRYFPEPDLPPVVVTDAMKQAAGQGLVTPAEVRSRLAKHGLPTSQVEVLVDHYELAELFLAAAAHSSSQDQVRIANWLTGEVLARLDAQPELFAGVDMDVLATGLVELAGMVGGNQLNSSAAKTVLNEMLNSGHSPEVIVKRLGLEQVSDSGELDQLVADALVANPQAVADYRAGKQQAIAALMGAVMKASGGRANPQVVNELLRQALAE